MYKVALVGLGGISNTHLPVWKELDDCELVAVCDTRPEQMDAYPDARHYTDFYEMLEKEKLDARIILQVHDELIIEAAEKDVEAAKILLRQEMENAVQLKVPLSVDCGVGISWYDAK